MKTVLITGASSGIGAAFARLFAKNGYRCVLVARRMERLEALARECEKAYSSSVILIPKDITQEAAVAELVQELEIKQLRLDVLINNAGVDYPGEFIRQDPSEMFSMINLNVQALTLMTRCFLPLLNENAHILNVASTAAFYPGPYMAVYYATKAYVVSFSLGLREELSKHKIQVSCLCPGPTETELFKDKKDPKLARSSLLKSQTAEQVALIAWQGLEKNKALIVPGLMNKISHWLSAITPNFLGAKVTAFLNK